MNNKTLEEKYKELLQEIKNEKLNWNFDDFIKKSSSHAEVPPFSQPKNIRFLKVFWIAASLALLFCLGLGLKMLLNKNEPIQNKIVKTEQKKNNDNLALLTDSLQQNKNKIEKQLLTNNSKKLKPKKQNQSTLTQNKKQAHNKSFKIEKSYQPNFVMVNGKEIESEKEAIAVTKEAFTIIALNMRQTINETKVINKLDINF